MQKLGLVCFLFAIGHATGQADIELRETTTRGQRTQTLTQLPFGVDFNIDQLRIHVKDSNSLYVVVVGPQGVVYNKVINTTTPKSVYVDLEKYRDGDYSIYIQDAKGNNVSGEFYKENIPFNY
ncbi:MAG: DUF3244 domain-containing protein [Bacteroidaceae bacterium]|nr:DUF3244 domain-containing protein [Bacteroidaceae bacterium]